LATAKEEMKHLSFYDYFLVNDDITSALANLTAIIRAERHRITRLDKYELDAIGSGESAH
jgi:guanylate kinase